MSAVSPVTERPPHALSPRIAAALGIDDEPLRAAPLELWAAECQCIVDGRRVDLSRRECALLTVLVAAPDRVLIRERLYELVWGHTMPTRGRDVDAYVRKVRMKLAEAAPDWSFIHTHHRVGYRFTPEKTDPSP